MLISSRTLPRRGSRGSAPVRGSASNVNKPLRREPAMHRTSRHRAGAERGRVHVLGDAVTSGRSHRRTLPANCEASNEKTRARRATRRPARCGHAARAVVPTGRVAARSGESGIDPHREGSESTALWLARRQRPTPLTRSGPSNPHSGYLSDERSSQRSRCRCGTWKGRG